MSEQNATAELTAEEQAYFDAGGETELKEAPVVQEGEQLQEGQQEQEQQEQQEAQNGERDEKGRFVPHQALHAEREEHKKTKAQLEEISRNQAVLNDRWNTLLKLREEQVQQQQEQAPPDPDTDIFGFAKWQADQLKALQEKVNNQETQTAQQQQIQQQEQAIWNDWSQSAQSYAAEKPEFGDAVQWLSDFRGKQLQAMAMIDERFASPQGVNEQINAELRAIIIGAKQKGINPAEVVHQLAVQYGFKPQAKDPNNVALPDSLARVADAQNAAKTVGQISGRSGSDAMTPESIAAMSPDEFERWAADPKNSRLLDKILGA